MPRNRGFPAAESIALCERLNAASACRAQRHIRGEIYGCTHHISLPAGCTTAARARICQGWPRPAAGQCRCSPSHGVRARILWLGFSLDQDLSCSSGDKASPCTLALLWQRNGSLPAAAGRAGQLTRARAVSRYPHPLPQPLLSCSSPCLLAAPAAPENQGLHPACSPPRLQRGECPRRGRLPGSPPAASSKAKPREAQGR